MDKRRYKPVCKSRVCKYVVYYISSPFNCRLRPRNVLASSPFVVRHSKARSLALVKVQASRLVCASFARVASAKTMAFLFQRLYTILIFLLLNCVAQGMYKISRRGADLISFNAWFSHRIRRAFHAFLSFLQIRPQQ